MFEAPDRAAVTEGDAPEIGPDEVLVARARSGSATPTSSCSRAATSSRSPTRSSRATSGPARSCRSAPRSPALRAGDRVVGECVIGDDHFGFSISGAAAEFFVARPAWLHRLPDELSWTMGALVEPFSVAYYALVRAGGVDASDTVAVLGAGPIGLAVAAAAARAWARGPSSSSRRPPRAARRVELGRRGRARPDGRASSPTPWPSSPAGAAPTSWWRPAGARR